MTYQEFIEFNKTKDQGEYSHTHHIIPKSVGGTDDEDNLIKLSWLTHYYAHYLLAKENPDNKILVNDFKKMGSIHKWLKFCYSAIFKSDTATQKLIQSLTGRSFSEEHKQKLSEAHKGKTHTEESKKKMSEAAKNRKPMSEETKRKIAETLRNRWRKAG